MVVTHKGTRILLPYYAIDDAYLPEDDPKYNKRT